MKFDVIIGNPPYQVSDGGHGRSSKAIYNIFALSAFNLNPEHVVMITPSRWFAGGKGLGDFKEKMKDSGQIRTIIDYPKTGDAFPGVVIAGGISYFHWQKKHKGLCNFGNFKDGNINFSERDISKYKIIVRDNVACSILEKIMNKHKGGYLNTRVCASKPFGIRTNYEPKDVGIPCWFIQRIGLKFADKADISDKNGVLSKWKLLIPKAPISGQTDFTKSIQFYYSGNTRIAKPGEICTESWQVAGAFDTENEAINYKRFIFTRVVRFLLLQAVVSQDVTRENFCFVPDLDCYKNEINDSDLIKMFEITDDEYNYICSRIGETK